MVVMVQRSAWIGLLILLLLPLVHAQSYSIVVNPIDNDIYRNESATFEVAISNFDDSAVEFQSYTIDPGWTVKVEPLNMIIGAKSQRIFTLSLRPSNSASYGSQGISVNFKDLTNEAVVEKTLVVGMRYPDGYTRGGYVPTVTLDIAMPYEVDPRNPVPLRLELRNRNPLNISNMSIIVLSPHFKTQSSISLPPLSQKTKDITGLALDPRTAPGEGELTVQLFYNGEFVTQLVKNYKVKEYTQIKQDVGEEAFFFKNVKSIRITNDGNVKNTAIVTVPTSLLKSLFVSSSLPYESEKRDGERVLVWSIALAPEASEEFTYTENYRILMLLVLLGIVGGIAYLLLRSPVVALKEAVAMAHHDGVSDIKVRVFVKNRSAKVVQGIQVTDRVPSLADVLKTESPGSLSPSKVAVSEKQGTLLRWDLEVLEPFEERILTYQVKSKLKIIGRMKLPNAKIRYVFNAKERVVYSNNIELVEKFKDR